MLVNPVVDRTEIMKRHEVVFDTAVYHGEYTSIAATRTRTFGQSFP